MTNAETVRSFSSRKENLKRIHQDRMRPLRVLEYLDNSAIFEHSPVEVREGFVISDRNNGDLFLILSFRNVADRPLAALKIRVLLYRDHQPVPYEKKEYEYSWNLGTFGIRTLNGAERKEKEVREETTVRPTETFGDGIYLPIPSTYFTKLQVDLLEVTFGDGETRHLGLTAGAKAVRFYELPDGLQDVYSDVNIFKSAETVHPIRVLPQEGENVWLCCCGHKNPKALTFCEACGRDRDWQLENLTVDKLETKEKEIEASGERRILHDLTGYKPKDFASKEEIEAKVELCNQVMERLAIQEKENEKKPVRIMIRVLIFIASILALYALIRIGYTIMVNLGYFRPGSDTSAAAEAARQFVRFLRM